MANKNSELTDCALRGYNGEQNTHLHTSPCWYAHAVGAHMKASGRSAPSDVRMGRGNRVRVRDLMFSVTGAKDAPQFTREQ